MRARVACSLSTMDTSAPFGITEPHRSRAFLEGLDFQLAGTLVCALAYVCQSERALCEPQNRTLVLQRLFPRKGFEYTFKGLSDRFNSLGHLLSSRQFPVGNRPESGIVVVILAKPSDPRMENDSRSAACPPPCAHFTLALV